MPELSVLPRIMAALAPSCRTNNNSNTMLNRMDDSENLAVSDEMDR